MAILTILQDKGRSVLCALLLITVCQAGYADYTDSIDLPALKTPLATHVLHTDITVKAGGTVVSVGERGIILYSDDKGVSWTQADVPTRAHLNAVYFHDAETGWAVGEDQIIIKTTDGGQSWSYLYDARDAEIKGPLLDVWFRNTQEGYAVGTFNTFLHTSDGGKSWQEWNQQIDNPDEWHLFSLAHSAGGRVYIASEAGLIFRSNDHGANFQPMQTGHEGSFHSLLVSSHATGMDTVLAFGVGGIVMLSRDSGNHWQYIDSGTQVGLSGGAWVDADTALITTADGSLLRVNTATGQAQLIPSETGLPLSSMAIIDQNTVAIVGLGGVQLLDRGLIAKGRQK